ncbi:hypothetical protein MFLAVUS_006544 [Mucor flavus]|uniref:Transposase n=1 Tax=Mucor flavus TaxID=439312 RepID=A0ABP9Z1U4_9FUNG
MKPKEAAAAADVNYDTALESLTANFTGLQIKKSIKAEFMREERNLSIKVVSSHLLGRNKEVTLEARVIRVDHWVKNGMDYLNNCIFVDESGFDINMRRSRRWYKRGTEAVITTLSSRGVSHTVIGAILAIGVVNLSMRESGNIKRRKFVGATKRKTS